MMEQLKFLNDVEAFLKSEISPNVNAFDTDCDAIAILLQKFKAAGFFKAYIPKAYGGLELNREQTVAFQEMVGRWAGAFGFLQVQAATVTWALLQGDDDALKERVFSDLIQKQYVVGNATSHLKRHKKPMLIGARVGGGYLVNGVNPYASGWNMLDKLVIGFNAENLDEVYAMIPFSTDLKGMSASKAFDTFSMRSINTVALHFDQVFIPDEMVLARKPQYHFIDEYRSRRPYAFPLGIAVEAMSQCQSTVPDDLRGEYADLNAKLDDLRARLMTQDQGDVSVLFADMMKICWQAVQFAFLLVAGRGALLSSSLQRLYRELYIWFVPRVSSETLKAWVAD
jgi:hypothetical protein